MHLWVQLLLHLSSGISGELTAWRDCSWLKVNVFLLVPLAISRTWRSQKNLKQSMGIVRLKQLNDKLTKPKALRAPRANRLRLRPYQPEGARSRNNSNNNNHLYNNSLWALDGKPGTMLRLISPYLIFQQTETHSSIIQSVQSRHKLPPVCGHLPFGTFGTSSQVCLCPKPGLVTTVLFRFIISWTGGFIHDEMKSF